MIYDDPNSIIAANQQVSIKDMALKIVGRQRHYKPFLRLMCNSPVWKIQKMVKNPCLSVKNMRIGCEKFQKKFGLNWRFP